MVKARATSILVFFVALFLVTVLGCDFFKVDVLSGERTLCQKCGKIISQNTNAIRVPKSEAGKYRIETFYGLCSECEVKEFTDPNNVAKKFFDALKNRNIKEAMKCCDVSIRTLFAYYPMSPQDFCSILAPKIDNNNIVSGCNFTKGDPFFVIGDLREHYSYSIAVGREGPYRKAIGYALKLHKVGGKWLIYDCDEGYIQ